MEVEKFNIEGPLLYSPRVFKDERGHFLETFNAKTFNGLVDTEVEFVQDNLSVSKKGVLRGLHFQAPPYAQGKLVRVVSGSVIDFAVDIRKNSPTYGKSISVKLSSENNAIFWIPEGFAHGFLTLEDNTVFEYKCTNFYHQKSEGDLLWSDLNLNFHEYSTNDIILSEKDRIACSLENFNSPF